MKRWTLQRLKANDFATYGILAAEDGAELARTIERPWVDRDANGKRDANISRIVAGEYRAVIRKSPKRGYDVPWLCGVPDVTFAPFAHEEGFRDATTCQIHRANLPGDLEGCIGVGTAFGSVQRPQDTTGMPGVTGSKNAFEKLMKELGEDREFTLIVLDVEDATP